MSNPQRPLRPEDVLGEQVPPPADPGQTERIKALWPQAANELQGLALHFTRTGRTITADQLQMAIRLGNERHWQLVNVNFKRPTPEDLAKVLGMADEIKQLRDEKITEPEHKFCKNNRAMLQDSAIGACCYCATVFPPELVTEWIDGGMTALCPKCSIDAVLPSSQVLISKSLLQIMYQEWFSP